MLFRNKQFKYYFLSIILLLILLSPNIIASIFSNDTMVSSPFKKVAFIIFSSTFYFLFLSIVRAKLLFLLSIPILLLSFLEIYVVLTLKTSINEGIFASILNTNGHEALEILSINWPYIILAGLITLIYVTLSSKIKYDFILPRQLRLILILLFISIQSLIVGRDIFIASSISKESVPLSTISYFYNVKIKKTFPLNWFTSTSLYIESKNKISEYNSKIDSFKFNIKSNNSASDREIYVIVIGESARKHNFSLYGYKRETNPLLKQTNNLIAFNNVITGSNMTAMSYPLFLSRATPEIPDLVYTEPPLISAFNEAGFKTFYISNQSLGYGSIFDIYSQQSDSLITLNASIDYATTDEDILPHFRDILSTCNNPKIAIFVHTMGSHFRYNLRHPEAFNIFTPTMSPYFNLTSLNVSSINQLVNSYDNSILFTDYFLSELITQLSSTNSQSYLFYASDHGENIFDDNNELFGHVSSSPTPYELEIPLFVWYSKKFELNNPDKVHFMKMNKNKPITSSHFFHSILDLSNLYISDETHRNSFTNEAFNSCKKRAYLCPDMTVKYYE